MTYTVQQFQSLSGSSCYFPSSCPRVDTTRALLIPQQAYHPV